MTTKVQIYDNVSSTLPNDEFVDDSEISKSASSKSFSLSALSFGLLGCFLGFLVRIVSLNARSIAATATAGSHDSLFYTVVSQADLTVHALIWIGFFAILLVCKTERRRSILTSSVVSLMIGLIAGSFLAWNFVDMMLGFPLSLASRIVSFNLMLLQCWLLYRCHDVCDESKNEETEPTRRDDEILFIV